MTHQSKIIRFGKIFFGLGRVRDRWFEGGEVFADSEGCFGGKDDERPLLYDCGMLTRPAIYKIFSTCVS